MRSSCACAARIVATRSSSGFENVSVGPQSGWAFASRARIFRARDRRPGSGGLIGRGFGRLAGKVCPGDEDAKGTAPDDDAPVARRVGPCGDLVVKGAVGRLEGAKVQAGRFAPLPAGFGR